MASIIRIKRSSGILAPATLKTAELAYAYGTGTQSNQGDRLFIGTGDDGTGQATSVTIIGGSYFTDLLDHVQGTLTASSAIVVDADSKIDRLLSGDIVIDGSTNTITGITTPTDSSGVVPKSYVDDQIFAVANDSTGVVPGTYGSATSIPIITVDAFGKLDSVGTSPLSTTLSIADSNNSHSIDLINDTLKFKSGGTLEINNDSSVMNYELPIVFDDFTPLFPLLDDSVNMPSNWYGDNDTMPRMQFDKYGRLKKMKLYGNQPDIYWTDTDGSGSIYQTTANPHGGYKPITFVGRDGITVDLTGDQLAGSGGIRGDGAVKYTIALDSATPLNAASITVDSGGFDRLVVGGDSNRGWASGIPGYADPNATSSQYWLSPATLQHAGNAVFGLSKDNNTTFSILQFFDSEGGNFYMGPLHDTMGSTVSTPVYGTNPAKVVGHWQARNPNYNLGTIEYPWRGTALDKNLDFTSTSGSYISMREGNDSAFSIRSRNNFATFPTFTTLVNYNTDRGPGSQIEYFIDQRVQNNKSINFGDSGQGFIGRETVDNWLWLSNRNSTLGLSGSTINLYSNTANDANKAISIQGHLKPIYSPTTTFDIGSTSSRWNTLYVDSVDRGHYIDSGTYGSAASIPVFTVNKTGLIDSIGTVPVAGVDSANWGSSSLHSRPGSGVVGDNLLTITTGDGTAHEVEISQFADSVQFGNHVRFSHQPNHKVIIPHSNRLSFQDHSHTGITGSPQDAYMFRNPGITGEFEFFNNGNFKIGAYGNKGTYFVRKVGFEGTASFDDSVTFSENINFAANKVLNIPAQTYLNFNNSKALIYSTSSSVDSGALNISVAAPMHLRATKGIYLYTYPNSNGADSNVYIGGNILPYRHPTLSPAANWDFGIDSSYTWNNAYFMGTVKAGSFTADNIQIDGNTISSTDSSNQIFIDPFPVGDSGDLVIRGNLIVQGTQTTVNSSIVSLNDKNLVLADSAATAAIADGAGLTVGGDQFDSTATKPQFVFDAATYRWDPNLPIDIPFVSLDSAVFLNGVALREVMEDHLDNFFGVDSNNAVTITYDDVANTMTWKGTDASTTQKGVSSFDSSNFTITAGHVAVTVLDGGTW